MNGTFRFDLAGLLPDIPAILSTQGIGPDVRVPPKIEALAFEARELFAGLARPEGIMADISPADFSQVFQGEGLNADDAPLGSIYQRADRMALFALTMGETVSETIHELFQGKDYALGAMVDGAASLAADAASKVCETMFRPEHMNPNSEVLSYSPGYCGWHITAQKKLFSRLQPEQIGIRINESCLMIPLKSVSGVLLDAPRHVHIFDATFAFCGVCRTFACRERFERVLGTGEI